MNLGPGSSAGPHDLLARVRAFCFPGSEEAARCVRALRISERGEFRTAPQARWTSFTAEEEIDATRSRFRWEARFRGGAMGFFSVTDAYEDAHGLLLVRLGGLIPVQKVAGPESDKGELQRYLASLALCPPMLLSNAALEWTVAGPATVRVRDTADPTGATVDVEIGADGRPAACQAERPRQAGKRAITTSWRVTAGEFREWEGLRVATQTTASWQMPDGPFPYFRGEALSFTALD